MFCWKKLYLETNEDLPTALYCRSISTSDALTLYALAITAVKLAISSSGTSSVVGRLIENSTNLSVGAKDGAFDGEEQYQQLEYPIQKQYCLPNLQEFDQY